MASFEISEKDLKEKLNQCKDKTFRELDTKGAFHRVKKHDKGIMGKIVEYSVIGMSFGDTEQAPDLLVDDTPVELKVTGVKLLKKEGILNAKEPVTITAVSPEKIIFEEFYSSNFWHKARRILFVYYKYMKIKRKDYDAYYDFPCEGATLYNLKDSDLSIVRNDWHIVRDYIIEAQKEEHPEDKYPGISKLTDDMMFLDTSPKWPNRPRFRFKRAFVDAIYQEYKKKDMEEIEALEQVSSFSDFDDVCHSVSEKYKGWTVKEILDDFGFEEKKANKAIVEQAVVRMFGGTSKKMNKIELFKKAGIIGKSIVLTQSGQRTEDMKLFPVDFDDLLNTKNTEDLEIARYFLEHHFLFIVLEEPSKKAPMGDNIFKGFIRYHFDEDLILPILQRLHCHIKDLIENNKLKDVVEYGKDGKPIRNKNGEIRSAPNLPKSADFDIFLRGSGVDSSKKPEEINGVKMLKQFFWIKGSVMADAIKEKEFL